MKKLLGILVISAVSASAFAQGTVTFANNTTIGAVKQWTSAADQTLKPVAVNGGKVQLIAAPLGTSLLNPLFTAGGSGLLTPNYSSLAGFLSANAGWSAASGIPANIAPLAGGFSGGLRTIGGIGAGASASYLVLGWTGTFADLDQALAAVALDPAVSFMGQSAVFTTTTGNPTTTPPGIAVNLNTTFLGMTLGGIAPVPEPTSFALAGLGLAALLVLRRRS